MDIYNRKIQTIFIYNSQDKCPLVNERIKTWYTNTHAHTHTYNATLLSQKNERNLAICENMDGSSGEGMGRWEGRKVKIEFRITMLIFI